MHWYPHHIGDHARAVAHLTDDEDLAYRRLKDWQAENELPIPLDVKWIARRIRRSEECVQSVLDDFFTVREDGWIEKNVWEMVEKYREEGRKKSEGGRKGAAARAAKKAVVEQPQPQKHGDVQTTQVAPTRAGQVCRMLREQCRMQGVSPSHPKLIEAINLGATDEAFIEAGHDAVANGKPFGYVLGTVIGRLRDASSVVNGVGATGAKNAPKARKTEAQKKWEEDCAARELAGVPTSPF